MFSVLLVPLSLRASVATRGNPVDNVAPSAHSYVSPADCVLAASCASLGFIASVARQSSGLVLRAAHVYSHHFFILCTFLLRENFICVRVFCDKAKRPCRGVRTSNLQCPRGQKIPPIYDLGWRVAIYSNKPAIFCKL